LHPRPEDGAKYNGVMPSVVVLQKILRKFLLEKNEKEQQILSLAYLLNADYNFAKSILGCF